MNRVIWAPDLPSLGDAVVAIGVFDGVHLGHQALLRDAVADARARAAAAVAVTFDRDPDQVVSPDNAAPQLLTLADKLAFIAETGIDTTLVVPFTLQLAQMAPEAFLESVLLRAVRPQAVRVGSDFRFGSMATGDVGTLQRAGVQHGFEVVPHTLVSVEGAAVTSTRIRSLVAAGNVKAAAELLGRPTRVSGTVRRGRGEGAQLGFPTANVAPVEYAALPADGVYAGRAVLPDDSEWAAAISVGTPPMFPEARDYLEAHVIDFDGDLYDAEITLEFFERLRELRPFGSVEELAAAIATDVEQALDIAGFDTRERGGATDDEQPLWESNPIAALGGWLGLDGKPDDEDMGDLEDGEPVVDDPAALSEAERAVMGAPGPFEMEATGEWVELLTGLTIAGGPGAPVQAYGIVGPLEAAGIPYAWNPYPPTERPTSLSAGGVYPHPFDVLVPAERLGEARDVMEESGSAYASELVSADDPEDVVSYEEQAPAVDDPATLEAAERAAQRMSAPQKRSHAQDDWVELLSGMPFDRRRLESIDAALFSAGIEHVWEPYAPDQAPLLRLGIWGTERFSVSVMDSDLDSARGLLASLQEADAE